MIPPMASREAAVVGTPLLHSGRLRRTWDIFAVCGDRADYAGGIPSGHPKRVSRLGVRRRVDPRHASDPWIQLAESSGVARRNSTTRTTCRSRCCHSRLADMVHTNTSRTVFTFDNQPGIQDNPAAKEGDMDLLRIFASGFPPEELYSPLSRPFTVSTSAMCATEQHGPAVAAQ